MGQRKDSKVGFKANVTVPEVLIVDFKGLYTYPNQFGTGAPGALGAVQNCALDAPGIVDCRRGKHVYSSGFTSAVQGLSFDNINDKIVMHASNSKLYIETASGSGSFTAITGTYDVPEVGNVESRVRTLNVNNNLYFTTGKGVYKLQSSSSTPIPAGAPVGLGGSGVTTGATGFMTNNVNVAYRVVWLYVDVNNNLVQGAPSDRIVVSNSSGTTANVNLTIIVPTTIDTTWQYQIFRSNQSASLATEPDDQMQQVYSSSPTSGQITSRVITVTDSQPDSLRGQTLYTTAQGIQNSNYQPPYAKSIALFKGSVFYGNTSLRQTYFSSLISGALLVNGDTISFYRGASLMFTVTGGAAENTATGVFLVATGGTAAQNITNTANSIVRVVNLLAGNTAIDAFYSSGFSESPGKMTFIDRLFNTSTFNVVCSRAGQIFSPVLPTSGATSANTSSGSVNPHYIYFSKSLQPEAVPLTNFLAIGSSAYPIIRILPLKESLIVIKSDGWYRVSGNSPASFSVSPIDVQLHTSSANSIVVLNNKVYAVTEQGAVAVQENGAVEIISIPIQRDLLSLSSSNYPGYKGASWAMAYPDDQKFYFYTVSSATDTIATKVYVYNYITTTWTIETKPFTAGFINPTDRKFYGSSYNAAGTQVYVERKSYSDFDFADEEYPVTITSTSGLNITLASAAIVTVGMTLGQGSLYSYITAVNLVTNVVTVSDSFAWTNAAAFVYVPITMSFTINPIDAGDPTCLKQFSEISIITLASSLVQTRVSFLSDAQQTGSLVPIVAAPSNGGFGIGAFGTGIFGGSATEAYLRTRMLVPGNAQKGNWLSITFTVAQAFKRVRFSGLQIVARKISVRQR